MHDSHRTPPDYGALTRFLRDRRAHRVDDLAALLGWSADDVVTQARLEGALRKGNLVRWNAAAGWLLEAWPLASLLATLGSDASLLPIGLHPLAMVVELPAYVIHGLRVQWLIEPMPHRVVRPATFVDYLKDVLHDAITSDTVSALRRDVEFIRAYDFPERG